MGFTHNLDVTEYILTLVDLNTCNWTLLLISLKQSIVEEVPVDSSLPKMLSEGIRDSFRKSTTRIISLQYRWGNVKYHASRFTRKLVPRSKQSTTYNAVNTYTCSTRKNARLRLATVNTWASFQLFNETSAPNAQLKSNVAIVIHVYWSPWWYLSIDKCYLYAIRIYTTPARCHHIPQSP